MSFDDSFVAHEGITLEMMFTRSLSHFMLLLCNHDFKKASCLKVERNESDKVFLV